MTNQNQSFLRFSLEESIWFQKGQEVSELYSLSIEPDVTITERNQYVVIEGTLQVTGEYRGLAENQAWENNVESDQIAHQRYVQNVELREEDGMFLFYHEFPVDISIPASRVENRSMVEVEISTFDYSMPENSCIKLIAELMITGIYDGEQVHLQPEEDYIRMDSELIEISSGSQIEETELENEGISLQTENEEESFEASAYALPREESSPHIKENEAYPFQTYNSQENFDKQAFTQPQFTIPMPMFTHQEIPSFSSEGEFANRTIEEEKKEITEGISLSSSTEHNAVIEESNIRTEMEEAVDGDLEDLEDDDYEDYTILEEDVQEVPSFNFRQYQTQREEIQTKDEKNHDEQKSEEEEDRNVLSKAYVSLTDFFGKKEMQTHAKLKVCIVQSGETLEDLANRYSVSKNEIISYNDLNDDTDVYEGQVLYIKKEVVHK